MPKKNKKYYWLQLHKDFFKRHDMKIIKAMPNGKDYIIFYMSLLLESIDHEGHLRFSELVPYNEEMLAVITDTNIDIVRSAIQIFKNLGLMQILDDQTIYMTETTKMLGYTTQWAIDKAKYRDKKALEEPKTQLEDNGKTKEDNVLQEKEIDKELELDIELDKDKEIKDNALPNPKPKKISHGEFNNVKLTEEEFKKLEERYPEWYKSYITSVDNYIEQKGKRYKSHYATILTWIDRDIKDGKLKEQPKYKSDGVRTI